MTLEQLEYFAAAVEQRTFFEAAEVMNLTQSALSKQIMNLEKELGVRLFDRRKRSAVLTEAGAVFYGDVKKLLLQYREALDHVRKYSPMGRRISLGTLPVLNQYGLTLRLKEFTTLHPGMSLSIDEVEDEALIRGLEQGTFDLAVIRQELLKELPCRTEVLAEDRLVILLPADHPLAGESVIRLQLLAKETFIFMHKHTGIYKLCVHACETAGFSPAVKRNARAETMISAVAAGEGIGMLLEKNLDVFHHTGVTGIPLADEVKSHLVLAWMTKPDMAEEVKQLIRFLSLQIS